MAKKQKTQTTALKALQAVIDAKCGGLRAKVAKKKTAR